MSSVARFTAAVTTAAPPPSFSDLEGGVAVQESLAVMSGLFENVRPRHAPPRREYIWTHDMLVVQNGVIT